MLRTRDRALLLDSLRPPAGYRLRRAVGTSFTLDLMALLTAPLAFTFFDAHDDDGTTIADPLALIEALRRHAEKITLFCQAGAITVPPPDQKLIAYLEGSVVEVRPRREGAIFHPKIWVLAFEADDRPTFYRVLCLSRNLTFARSWDTCLRLDGAVADDVGDQARNQPFANLLAALPKLATRDVPNQLQEDLRRMTREIRRVDFRPPEPFTEFRVHNVGLGDRSGWPFPKAGRSLVVSPFLGGAAVRQFVDDHGLQILISRPEAFDEVLRNAGPDALPRTCYVLAPEAGLDARAADEMEAKESGGSSPDKDHVELAGLHAKLFLFESGPKAHLFAGSANATSAAFHGNVEVLVELVGETGKCGIESFLGPEDDPKLETIRSLLHDYNPSIAPEPDDDEAVKLAKKAERLARRLGAARLTAIAREVDAGQRWNLELSGELGDILADGEVGVWPATLSPKAVVRIDGRSEAGREPMPPTGRGEPLATFRNLSFEALTAFFAFELSLREGAHEVRKRFAVTAKLVGAPEDRKERLLRSFLSDRRRVLQLLLLILSGEGADVSAFVQAVRRDGTNRGGLLGGWEGAALLEALLRSLSRNPGGIDEAARLISDLRKTPEGKDLLPEGLDEIWEPVWAAREALRR